MENPKIKNIDLSQGEGFSVRNQGSTEMSIYVYVDQRGVLCIRGPMNHHETELVLRDTGIYNTNLE